ncbi:MAG: ribosome silencing factor [bacterium]|nr:ribosome silencing factor [bacterium]
MTSLQLARRIAKLLDDKQATDIVILDLRKVPQIADFFILATGMVDLHVKTLSDYVEDSLRNSKLAKKPFSREGEKNLSWVVLDYGSVVLHIFRPETRNYYRLDKLWGDVPRVSIKPKTRIKTSNNASQ